MCTRVGFEHASNRFVCIILVFLYFFHFLLLFEILCSACFNSQFKESLICLKGFAVILSILRNCKEKTKKANKPKLSDQQVRLYPNGIDTDIFLMPLSLSFAFLAVYGEHDLPACLLSPFLPSKRGLYQCIFFGYTWS